MNDAAQRPADDARALLAGLFAGEVRALARAITAVESGAATAPAIQKAIQPRLGNAVLVGFTGAPGAGKSTLINAYIGELRRRGKTVAVAAVDPSSPISGGAVLGDRIRMGEHTVDDGVYIRSLASRGHLGGLSAAIAKVVDVIDAAGWDVVILETVGAGQSEVEVAEIADVKVVVNAPGLGDDIQALKAGILEIADILVVNKADLPLADLAASTLESMLGLRAGAGASVPIVKTVATEADGVAELADRIEGVAQARSGDDRDARARARVHRLLAQAAGHQAHDAVAALPEDRVAALCRRILAGEVDLDNAARELLARGATGEDMAN
ncbi:MAG: methylmalonyl Co-A mutase-associated GTPase MeaB [Alphaproteobacteria bacterium]|jgi:LAO/AO transport system kinase|nr:methylmalonyl Co-A mutase-associated GTPase MeaB [Alphaproteobacteria bacterium]